MITPDQGLPVVRETLLGSRHSESRLLIWQLDWVDGRFVQGAVETMLANLRGMLTGRGNAAAAVVFHVHVQDSASLEGARAQLQALLNASRTALDEDFRAAGLGRGS